LSSEGSISPIEVEDAGVKQFLTADDVGVAVILFKGFTGLNGCLASAFDGLPKLLNLCFAAQSFRESSEQKNARVDRPCN